MHSINHLEKLNVFVNPARTDLNNFVRQNNYSKVWVLVDENTERYCLPLLKNMWGDQNFQTIRISAGENYKNINTVSFIWRKMMAAQTPRNALLINLGGGVIGDMGGFCASTFKRGIDFIQIPTTLLAQIDASIGGKLGIDFDDIKNGIGLFRHPKAVFIFPEFLKTLSMRQIKNGFAEIIKHALIADEKEWQAIRQSDTTDLTNIDRRILHSLRLKAGIVAQDPHEKGMRKLLNFGHTIGHAVESYFIKNRQTVFHGEAVAAGIICESYLSHQLTGLPTTGLKEITDFIKQQYQLPILNKRIFPNLIELMYNDKKNKGRVINFTLLKSIGTGTFNHTASEALILDSLNYYASLG